MSYKIRYINDLNRVSKDATHIYLAIQMSLNDSGPSAVKLSKVSKAMPNGAQLKNGNTLCIGALLMENTTITEMTPELGEKLRLLLKVKNIFSLIQTWASTQSGYPIAMWENYNYFKLWQAIYLAGANGEVPVLCTIGCKSLPEFSCAIDTANALNSNDATKAADLVQMFANVGTQHRDIGRCYLKMYSAAILGNIGTYLAKMHFSTENEPDPSSICEALCELDRCAELVGAVNFEDLESKIYQLMD